MKSFTCIVMIFIVTWPVVISAQDRYRDEIDKVRNKYTDEIIEYAAKPCYTALLNDTDLLKYVSDKEEMKETVKQVIILAAYNKLSNMVKGTSAKYRSDTYQRYADYCIGEFKPVIKKLVKKAQMERKLK